MFNYGGSYDKKQKKNLKRIIIALSLFLVIKILDLILEKGFGSHFPNGIASIIKMIL